ncbi:MAG: DUF4910 domain-containing protein [Candidatus Heimdallarchaeota archaeon]|nr:DUF4910 domain-containing protein [Candidatus Heimdallarchaeota archaeon]
MHLDELVNIAARELSGERAKKLTGLLSQYHRIQASTEFLTTIELLRDELKSVGDANFQIHEYIADGTKRYYDWNTPISWDIEDGSLTLIEPEMKNLCRFSAVPESVCTHSKSIDITAEVIHVHEGKREDFQNIDVKGKIVLTSASPRTMIERLYENGAIGIIAYPTEERAKGYSEMIQYVGLWPNADNVDKSTFGFSLSRQQALEIINHIKMGKKVTVQAKIKADLYNGKMHVLSTKIEGSVKPEEEIIVIAHICHPAPSANDNASGSALLMEIFKTIKTLLNNNTIKSPERTIRFLWVPEFHGTIPWIEENFKSNAFSPILCINLDMVGEHPALVGYPFTVNKASISTPTFLNDLIAEIIDKIKDNTQIVEQGGWQFPWNFRIKQFAGGSDHLLFNDEPARIPSVMFGHSDIFHHTNLDTIEKVDPTTLKRVGCTALATILASSYKRDFSREIQRIYLKGLQKRKGLFLDMYTYELTCLDKLENDSERELKSFLLNQVINTFEKYEKGLIEEIERIFGDIDEELTNFIQNDLQNFKQLIQNLREKTEIIQLEQGISELLNKIPLRKWEGPFNSSIIYQTLYDPESLQETTNLTEEKIAEIKQLSKILMENYGGFTFEIVNLIDNTRSVKEILLNLALINWRLVQPKNLISFIEMLESLQLIEY